MNADDLAWIRHTHRRIIFFTALMLLIIWSGLYVVVQRERQSEIDDAFKDTATYARTFAERTVRTLQGLDQVAIFLKYQAERDGLNQDIPRMVRESRFAGQPFVILSIIDEAGDLVSSSQVPFIPSNIKDREHFIVHRMADIGPFISKPLLGRSSGKWSIQLSRRISKPDGSFGGVVVVSVDPYYFAEFYRLVNLGEKSSITLAGRDGIIRARQSGAEFSLGQDISQRIEEILSAGSFGQYNLPSVYDGLRRFYSFQTVEEYPLLVIVGITEAQVFQALNHRLPVYYGVCAAISIIILLFVAFLFVDIARRRQAEEKLRQSEEMFRYLTENTNDVIWHLDPQFRFDYVSPADERMRGYSASEVLGTTPWDQTRPEKADYLREQHAQRMEAMAKSVDRTPLRLELEVRCKNGGWIWGEINVTAHYTPDGTFVGLHGVTRDISARKRAEKVLMENQVRYHALVEQSFEALALIDLETREIVEINRRFTELLGYSLPEDAPLYADRCVVDTPENLNYFYGIYLRQHRILPVDLRILRRKNGVEAPAERAGSVVSIGGREYLLATFRDITASRRRQAEAARDMDLAKRVQQNLLPELSESTAVMCRTLYYPSHFVSGDSYHMEWRNEGKLLCGYLIDVSGHGLATALQTASLMALLREASSAQVSLLNQMQRISSRSEQYFTEGAYAALFGFELDLAAGELQYVAAGITQFYFNGEKILTPSMFVGILPTEDFCVGRMPVSPSDNLFFLTDGFTDLLASVEGNDLVLPKTKDFDKGVALLEEIAVSGLLRDDATAICIRINA